MTPRPTARAIVFDAGHTLLEMDYARLTAFLASRSSAGILKYSRGIFCWRSGEAPYLRSVGYAPTVSSGTQLAGLS